MPELTILRLAEKYGRPPQEVEQEWEPWWVNRAVVELEAQYILDERREAKRPKAR